MEKHTHNEREEYVLNLLQNLSPSDSPKHIRANMDKFQQIETLFETIHILMKQMNFNDQVIQCFGEFVIASPAANLNRRTDKYLYLAYFCLYQRFIFEDWMTLTFLNVCKLAINKVGRKEKNRLFQNRKQNNKKNNQIKEDLKYSFNYKAMDDYLILKHLWEKNVDAFLDKANLRHLKDFQNMKNDFKKMIAFHFKQTNERILKEENKHFRKRKNNKYYVVTPKVEKQELDFNIFPSEASIPISEVLATIDSITNFLEEFRHLQCTYRRKKPNKSVFFAGITAYGCNLGIPAMAQAASQVQANHLENRVNWYSSLENINRANDAISKFTDSIQLANLYRKNQDELRTSSDGQKIKTISENTIFASYSTKYFDK